MNVEEIFEDLCRIDPVLRNEEDELKKIIGRLIQNRPEAEPDEDFKARLKAELLEEMSRKKRKRFFIMKRENIIRTAGIAAAAVIVLTFALNQNIISPGGKADSRMAVETEGIRDMEKTVQKQQPSAIPALPELRKEAVPQAAERPAPKRLSEAADISEEELLVSADEYGLMDNSVSAPAEVFNTEEYSRIYENDFFSARRDPLSTFSIDVDTASYSNVRRYINSGTLPPTDAVRIEELINYFSYDYPQPQGDVPFSFTSELGECPWNSEHRLLLIGLQGYKVPVSRIPRTNLVFLIDSSGSMTDENKLPLLKESMKLMIENLRQQDRVSIVAYAGSAGLVLPPTPANDSERILSALDSLSAGGSTAGGAGIDLAYKTAAENLFEDGNNRVILATDGDFNVGQSSESELVRMIEQRRDQGIFLTVLGFGMGNYKDSRMESLADTGNGTYAYIDTINEARKVLVEELSSTLLTIAKDVKIQVEFNPAEVESYRLIGYENRVMEAQDFDNDKKDAGEIGAGHSVTALYEIVPADRGAEPVDDGLRYQNTVEDRSASASGELGYIKFRYKKPDSDTSILLESVLPAEMAVEGSESLNFRFASAVAEWGLILRGSGYAADADINDVISRVKSSLGDDEYGYRAEFLNLLHRTGCLVR